jgi:hypothetical protein
MGRKIFVNYRRDDAPGDARGVHAALAAEFGRSNVFMDVDNLTAGQRFDKELMKALRSCDIFVAIIGPGWMESLIARNYSKGLDHVREEIREALQSGIAVIPVCIGHDGRMPSLPRPDDLPSDIRNLVLHQKHDIRHEHFARDMAELVTAIRNLRGGEPRGMSWSWFAWAAALCLVVGTILAFQTELSRFWRAGAKQSDQTAANSSTSPAQKSDLERAWIFIQQTDDPARLEAFLQQFGDSAYAPIVRARLQELQQMQRPAPPASIPPRTPTRSFNDIRETLYQTIMTHLATRTAGGSDDSVSQHYRDLRNPKAMAICIDWVATTPETLNGGQRTASYRSTGSCGEFVGGCARRVLETCQERGTCRTRGQKCALIDVNGRNAIEVREAWLKRHAR